MNGKTRWYCVCDALGVQPNEEFKIKNNEMTYKIVIDDEGNDGVLLVKEDGEWKNSCLYVNSLFDGETVVIHMPFIPKEDEDYYYLWFGADDNLKLTLEARETSFMRLNDFDKIRLAQGNCFRSEKEIYNIYGTLENAFQQIYNKPWAEFLKIYNEQRGKKE